MDQRILQRQYRQSVMDLVTVRPVQNCRGKQCGRFECVTANQIEEQEPHGNHDGADDARDRAVDNYPRPRMLHIPTSNPQDPTRQASRSLAILTSRTARCSRKRMTPTYARISKLSRLALLALLITTVAGCALNPLSVPVTYQPASNIAPVPGASSVRAHVVAEDQRADKTNVGQYDQQPIAPRNNVIDTARYAVQSELQPRGFVIDTT